jgi:hypothetical protein
MASAPEAGGWNHIIRQQMLSAKIPDNFFIPMPLNVNRGRNVRKVCTKGNGGWRLKPFFSVPGELKINDLNQRKKIINYSL